MYLCLDTPDLQIVSIDGLQVKELEHPDVVKMFQTRDKVSLVILPARYKTVSVWICKRARLHEITHITVSCGYAMYFNVAFALLRKINA